MKYPVIGILVAALGLTVAGCGQKSHEHDKAGHDMHGHEAMDGAGDKNKPLYDEVMAVHDEAMPKLDDIYKLKESLKNKIANTPTLANNKKQEIENSIVQLDSASESMMDWMHQFKPLPDSVDEAASKEYLQQQKVKIETVKQKMLHALEQGKTLNQ